MDIKDKVVVVTGASSGIGEAMARLVHERGGKPVLAARRADRLEALSRELGGALAVQTDVTDYDQLQALFDKTIEAHGRIDVLVNNAGQGMIARIEEMSVQDMRQMTEIHLVYPAVATRLVAPIMRKQGGGAIVNITSGTTKSPYVIPGYSAYTAAKAGLNTLTQYARKELEDDGIAVSLVIPYLTKTEFHDQQIKRGDTTGGGPRPGAVPHTPEMVAEKMIEVIESGEPEIRLTPDDHS